MLTTNDMPKEVKVALTLLWSALIAGALSLIPFFTANWVLVSTKSFSWWAGALWGYPVNIAMLIGLARGYGWLRWLLAGAVVFGFIAAANQIKLWSQIHEQLGVFLYVEPFVLLSRLVAIVLLLKTASTSWYARSRANV